MIALYLDENGMTNGLVRALRASHIDVVTVQQVGARGRTDEYHLLAATQAQRTVYTRDIKDFSRLHAAFMRSGRHHAGIILVTRATYGIGEELHRLLALCAAKTIAEMRDTVEYLSRWS